MSSSQEEIYNLVVNQLSSDNNQRIIAEQAFNQVVANDPSQLMNNLISIASNESLEIHMRQSSLLHLKRLVPRYWSAAFQSFIGPYCISQDIKIAVRATLLSLISNADSRIRNSSSYAIIQISQVDYPDEWPTLLIDLYNMIQSNEVNKMLGGLTVLKDLFDDLVTDEQFFEGGVGETVIHNCFNLLHSASVPIEIQIEALKLLEICLTQSSTQLNINATRKSLIKKIIDDSLKLLLNSLNTAVQLHNYSSILQQCYKFEIYKCLNSISNNFNHIFNLQIKSHLDSIIELIIRDLEYLNNIKFNTDGDFQDFQQLTKTQVMPNFETFKFLNELFAELFQLLTSLSSKFTFAGKPQLLQKFVDLLIQVTILPDDLKEEWSGNFNSFVTVESGLSIDLHVRDSVLDYLVDSTEDSQLIYVQLYERFDQLFQSDSSVELKESIIFLLGALFQNEEHLKVEFSVVELLNKLVEILATHKDEFLVLRLILILPRFFGKFEKQIDVQSFGLKTLEQILHYQITDLTKAGILFSFTYFNYFISSKIMNLNIQRAIIQIIIELNPESDEDTNITLLESLSVAICINNKELALSTDVLKLILEICFKDSSNLGLADSGRECISDLVQGLTEEEFLYQCNEGLPILLNVIEDSLSVSPVEFTLPLDLSLEFLITFVDEERPLNQDIFNYVFPSLTKLILSTDDDQLLQVSNEVFNKLLNHDIVTTYIFNYANGLDILLQIVSKYLSPTLSDQAILNVGELITKLIKNFASFSNVGQYLDQILQTVTRRLIIAKEFPTIENLILIFANLAINSPRQTVEFLSTFEINGNEMLLSQVMTIWLQAFETIRGFDKILLNVRALSEIFLLEDPRLSNILVNSDDLVPDESLNERIITRSMRKNLKFIQISAPLKIIKLFINELKFHLQQPDFTTVQSAIGLVGNKHTHEEQDDEWEDLNEYEEFAQYDHDGDDDDDVEDDEEGHGSAKARTGDDSEEIYLLKSFFRKVGNDDYFKDIFSSLNADEQKLLTEFVNS